MWRAIDQDVLKAARIARTSPVVAIVDESGAVERVRPTLRDGIDHAAGGPAVFRRVVRDANLNLTNRGNADPIADACASALGGQECLVAVARR